MNFWNDRDLAMRFKNNAVPSKERFLYLLLWMILMMIMSTSWVRHSVQQETLSQWDYMADVLAILGSIFGTYLCYQTNRAGDDHEFIERYISLSTPVGAKVALLALLCMIPLIGIEFLELPEGYKGVTIPIFVALLLGIFYWRLDAAIKIASH